MSTEIFAGGLLIALFEEEETRAADWLAEAGLSLPQFFEAFRIETAESPSESASESTAMLQMPISAPPFPMGDYGVPPNVYQTSNFQNSVRVKASRPDGQAPPVGYSPSEPQTETEGILAQTRQNAPRAPKQEPDQWTQSTPDDVSEENRSQRFYTLHQTETNSKSAARFYLDDQPIVVGRISRQLESTLEMLVLRFSKQAVPDCWRRIPAAGGGVTTVTPMDGDIAPGSFLLATEHLLLATVLDDSDVGLWLRDNGLDPTELYRRIENSGNNVQGEINSEDENTFERIKNLSAEIFDLPASSGSLDSPSPEELPDELENAVENQGEIASTSINPVDFSEKIHRLIDAAANRAREAIRVLEDFARFVLDDARLTRQLKDFRHELQTTLQNISMEHRLRARNTPQDVGTEIEGRNEYRRESSQDVLAANFSRLQESLRSLEEFSKIVHPSLARQFERLRYRGYTLHKILCLAEPVNFNAEDTTKNAEKNASVSLKRENFEKSRLYALVETRSDDAEFADYVQNLLNGGVDVIQLRDKKADDRTLLARSRILRKLIDETERPVFFVINDRPDLARLADADAVHVGQEELAVEDVRKIVGPEMLIGVSTHSIEQAWQAVLDGADYIGVGPIFASPTKSALEPLGADWLKEIASEIDIPAFAIGGITLENLDEVLATGIDRIVLGSALQTDPCQTTEKFARVLETKAGMEAYSP